MKLLIVTAKAVKATKKFAVPNLEGDMTSPEYRFHVKKILQLRDTQPNIYNKIMYWD
jgi:hypothetical protein